MDYLCLHLLYLVPIDISIGLILQYLSLKLERRTAWLEHFYMFIVSRIENGFETLTHLHPIFNILVVPHMNDMSYQNISQCNKRFRHRFILAQCDQSTLTKHRMDDFTNSFTF